MNAIKKFGALRSILALSLITLEVFLWWTIFSGKSGSNAKEYFLDVGTGESELIIFPGGIKILIDAGPSATVISALQTILPADDHYIDIGIISSPRPDDFGGYNFLFDSGYHFGTLIYNGRNADPETTAWTELFTEIKQQNIPFITLEAGDSITHASDSIEILSPNNDFARSGELDDTGFVEKIASNGVTTLLTADTGMNVEDFLLANKTNLRADILKLSEGGGKFASGNAFLQAVAPSIAVITGTPSKETLARLASSTNAKVVRANLDGTLEIYGDTGKLRVNVLYNEGK